MVTERRDRPRRSQGAAASPTPARRCCRRRQYRGPPAGRHQARHRRCKANIASAATPAPGPVAPIPTAAPRRAAMPPWSVRPARGAAARARRPRLRANSSRHHADAERNWPARRALPPDAAARPTATSPRERRRANRPAIALTRTEARRHQPDDQPGAGDPGQDIDRRPAAASPTARPVTAYQPATTPAPPAATANS